MLGSEVRCPCLVFLFWLFFCVVVLLFDLNCVQFFDLLMCACPCLVILCV